MVFPSRIMDHDIEDVEQFSHGRDEGHHFGFAIRHQSVVEGFDRWVVLFGDDGEHEQGGADLGASASGGAFASEVAAVPVGGDDAEEAGDLPSTESSQLGEFGDEDRDGGWSQAGNRSNDPGFGLNLFVAFNEMVLLAAERLELFLIEPDGLFDHLADDLHKKGCRTFVASAISASSAVRLFQPALCPGSLVHHAPELVLVAGRTGGGRGLVGGHAFGLGVVDFDVEGTRVAEWFDERH